MTAKIRTQLIDSIDWSIYKEREINIIIDILGRFARAKKTEIEMSDSDIKRLGNKHYTKAEMLELMEDTCQRIVRVAVSKIDYDTEKVEAWALFTTVTAQDGKVKVRIHPDLAYLFTDIDGSKGAEYIALETDNIKKIKGKTAKVLYIKMIQFKNTGVYVGDIKKLRKQLGASEETTNSSFNRQLRRAIESLVESGLIDKPENAPALRTERHKSDRRRLGIITVLFRIKSQKPAESPTEDDREALTRATEFDAKSIIRKLAFISRQK